MISGFGVADVGWGTAGFKGGRGIIPPRFPPPAFPTMPEILKLRGAPAHSAGRLARLVERCRAVLPSLRNLTAEHWYYVELDAPLGEREQAAAAPLAARA